MKMKDLLIPYYAEAERARAREILRKLKDKQITDEWVPRVQTPTDFIDLNKPSDANEEEKSNKPSDNFEEVKNEQDNDSDVEIIEPKDIKQNDATTVTRKNDDDKKVTVTKKADNVFDISFSCLNDPIKNIVLNDSMEFANDIPIKTEKVDTVLSVENKKGTKRKSNCFEKDLENENVAKKDVSDSSIEIDLPEYTQENMEADEKNGSKDLNLMTNEEEVKAKKEATEKFAEFCKRKNKKEC
uniref:Uncharacterized protein n=1 Tax=Panagrolaimus superbus TaxID=310955 RepID=A0A914Z8W4_9BILA